VRRKIPMAGDEKIVAQTFTDYVQAFQTLKPHAVLSYCDVPCVFISAQGVVVMTNPTEIETLVGRMMAGLKARGYGWSELTSLQVSQMSETIAFVSVSRIRYKTDKQELERLGETYTFRKRDDAWRIAVATTHDADSCISANGPLTGWGRVGCSRS
jgi:ketosteroid isomerase-like protein